MNPYENGTSVIFDLRNMIINLGFIDLKDWETRRVFYFGLKNYWGDEICVRKYDE